MSAARTRLATVCVVSVASAMTAMPHPLEAGPAVSADAQTSAGYEWNINHAAEAVSQADSAVARAGATIAVDLVRTRHLDLYAEGGVDAKTYVDYDDLSSVRESARLGMLVSVSDHGMVHVGSRAAHRQYRDSERSAFELDASAAYRHRLARYLAARIGYEFERHDANADPYDFDLHAATAGVFVGGWTLEIGLRYALELSDTTLYTTEQATGLMGDGRGRQERIPTSTFAPSEVAYSEQTVGHASELDVVVRPARWIRIGASYHYGMIDTTGGWVSDQNASAWVRLHWQ